MGPEIIRRAAQGGEKGGGELEEKEEQEEKEEDDTQLGLHALLSWAQLHSWLGVSSSIERSLVPCIDYSKCRWKC